jgi:hypothetical protein
MGFPVFFALLAILGEPLDRFLVLLRLLLELFTLLLEFAAAAGQFLSLVQQIPLRDFLLGRQRLNQGLLAGKVRQPGFGILLLLIEPSFASREFVLEFLGVRFAAGKLGLSFLCRLPGLVFFLIEQLAAALQLGLLAIQFRFPRFEKFDLRFQVLLPGPELLLELRQLGNLRFRVFLCQKQLLAFRLLQSFRGGDLPF